MYELGMNRHLSIKDKFYLIPLGYILCIFLLALIGMAMLYSAAEANMKPWAIQHCIRFGIFFILMILLAFIDAKIYYKYTYIIYFVSLLLLIGVEAFGAIGMGAKRWIDFRVFKIQPSELMKIATVLVLAKYFNNMTLSQIRHTQSLILPALLVLLPVGLIILEPDLGTALSLLITAGVMFFCVGVQIWKFVLLGSSVFIFAPIAWHYLHDYQKERVLTFLNPERDPLGAGYHIIQSKIALGSGGVFGKGFLNGTQSHLNFLPEKHTDFIFTMLSEEFGLIGGTLVILLNLIMIIYGYIFAYRSTNYYAKLVIIGLNTNYFMYVFINIAMVIGLLPVVGIPLPLISYGGTVMLSVMTGFGIILCMDVNRTEDINKQSLED